MHRSQMQHDNMHIGTFVCVYVVYLQVYIAPVISVTYWCLSTSKQGMYGFMQPDILPIHGLDPSQIVAKLLNHKRRLVFEPCRNSIRNM